MVRPLALLSGDVKGDPGRGTAFLVHVFAALGGEKLSVDELLRVGDARTLAHRAVEGFPGSRLPVEDVLLPWWRRLKPE